MSRRFAVRVNKVSFNDAWKSRIGSQRPIIHMVNGLMRVGTQSSSAADIFIDKIGPPVHCLLYMTSPAWGMDVKLQDDANFRITIEVEEPASGQKDSATTTIALDYDMLKPSRHPFDAASGRFSVEAEIIPEYVGRRVYKGMRVTRSIHAGAIYNAIPNPAGVKLRAAIWAPKTAMDSVRATNELVEAKYNAVPPEADAVFSKDPGDKVGEHPYLRARFLLDTVAATDEVIASRLNAENTAARTAGKQILHLFVGPEWYFRRGNRPYTQSDMVEVIHTLSDLLTNKPEYAVCRKWMMVPGTIFWGVPAAPNSQRVFVFNSAPVYWMGQFHTYVKRNEADIDSEDKKRGLQVWGMNVPDSVGRAALAEMARDCMYNIGQYRFGLEVCRDHAVGRLMREWHKGGQPPIDVHVVTANDVQPNLSKKVVRNDGVFVYCDGNSSRRRLWQVRRQAATVVADVDASRRTFVEKYAAVSATEQARTELQQKLDLNQLVILDPNSDKRAKSQAESENKALRKKLAELDGNVAVLSDLKAAESAYTAKMEELEKQPVFEDQRFRLSVFALEDVR